MKKTVAFILSVFGFYFSLAQNPIANFQANQTFFCANNCINFTNLSTNATSWQWSFQGASPASSTAQNPQNICYLTEGNYNVTLVAINGIKRDTLTFTNYINVFPAPQTPVITQLHDTLYCSTDPLNTSYQWYADTNLIPGATDTFLVISQGGIYEVVVVNENGCGIAVGINAFDSSYFSPPVSNFNTSNTSLCANSCIAFNNLSSDATYYQWYFPGGIPSSSTAANPQSVCYDTTGSYDVTLISSNSYYTDTLTLSGYINVLPAVVAPVITASNDSLICSTNPAYTSYQWYVGNILIPGAIDTLLIVDRNGNYGIQVHSSSGCSLNASFTDTLFHPTVNFTAADSIVCVHGCINFNNLSQNYTSTQWFFPGGNPSTDTIGSTRVCYDSSGTYSATLIVSDGFVSRTLVLNNYITVNSGPPTPVVTQSNDTIFSTTNALYTSYQWYKNNVIINGAVDTLLTGATTNAIYMVSVTNSIGCSSTGSITIGNPITASFYANDSVICGYDCINFTNLSIAATSWKWSFPGAADSTSTDQNPQNICYQTAGNYNVTLIATNGGSSDTLTINNCITVLPAPLVPVITQVNDTLYCSTDPDYTSYQWYLDSTLINGATDIILVVSHSGNYNVQVTNNYGCKIAVGISLIVPCSANFSISADSIQLHHYIVTNNATGASPISYYWSWGDGTHDTIPYPTHTYADSSFYTICLSITDANNCMSTFCDSSFHAMRTTNTMVSMTVIPAIITGVQAISLQTEEITLYPNPATNELTIHFSSVHANEAVTVSIMNVLGETVQEEKLKWSGDSNINIRNLSQGMYFLQMKSAGGSFTKKFVKE